MAFLITSDEHADARILEVRPQRIIKCLEGGKIAIVAGFQGMSLKSGDITTLGRGGSDTTAVALAAALQSRHVEFFKDVEGIFSKDPKHHSDAQKYDHLSFGEALALTRAGAQVLQPRCIEIAERNGIPLWVLPFDLKNTNDTSGTWIGQQNERINQRTFPPKFENSV